MNSGFQKKWPAFWFYGIVATSVFLVIVTLFVSELQQTAGIIGRLTAFSLGGENNFSRWWSGALLLLGAIHAFDGYVLLRRRQSRGATGWLLISIILVILSVDEISSIHERANRILQFGPWLSLLPFAIILLTMLAYALTCLWSTEEHRPQVWLIALGFFFLGSVAFQEFLQHRIDWTGEIRRYRKVVEEGTELLGMIILLKASMTNTQGVFGDKGGGSFPTFESICLLRVPILSVGLVFAAVLAYISANLPDQQRGHPADWLAAMVFLFAALAAGRRFFAHGENIDWSGWSLATLCCLASAASVAIAPARVIELTSIGANARMCVLFVVSLLICGNWILTSTYPKWVYIPVGIVIGALALSLLRETSLLFVYGFPQYLALLVYYVNSTQNCQERSPFR